jgi:hypothetical protein
MDELTIEAMIQANRERVSETLNSFRGKRGARTAAFHMATTTILTMEMAHFFETLPPERREDIKEEIGVDPWGSERIGTWQKYRLGPAIIAAYHADPEYGTPLSVLTRTTFETLETLVPGVFRERGTENLPLKEARPRDGFRQRLREELRRLDKCGHVTFDEQRGIVKRGNIVPEKLIVDFYGELLGKGGASFKRSLTTAKVGMDSPMQEEITSLIQSRHYGLAFRYRKEDFDRWWGLYGPDGATFAFQTTNDSRVLLQYVKAGMQDTISWQKEESDAYLKVRQAVEENPFVGKELLKRVFGPDYVTFVRVSSRNPVLYPIQIGETLVSPELGKLLHWSTGDGLSLEQHPARLTLTALYDRINPTAEEMAEMGESVKFTLSELGANQVYSPESEMDRRVMESLSPTYVVQKVGGQKYEVVPGMQAHIISLSKHTGNLFAGQKSSMSGI